MKAAFLTGSYPRDPQLQANLASVFESLLDDKSAEKRFRDAAKQVVKKLGS